MRDILFRAKSTATNEWQYGYFAKEYDVGQIYLGNGHECVHENTLGQFTGLTDKNGTKIFEGDIVEFEDICCEGGAGYEYPDEWAVEAINRAEIIFKNGCVSFGKALFEPSVYEDIKEYYPNFNQWFSECVKVVGNIYDNADLLEVKTI